MSVEFALRPRIRLREAAPKPKRSRLRLPRFALPVALYWTAAAGITYAFVHEHDARPLLADRASDEVALGAEPVRRENRPWWRAVPTEPATEPSLPSEPQTRAPVLEVVSEPATPLAPAIEPTVPAPALDVAAAQEARRAPDVAAPRTANDAFPARALRSVARAGAPMFAPAEPPLFPEAHDAPAPAPSPPPGTHEARDHGLPSCETALESAHQDVDFSQGNGTADLPTSVIAAVLENGAWLGSCAVPATTSLEVCVAIRGGSVIGASVVTRPPNAEIARCVKGRASGLQFPYSAHVDIARTRF